MKREKKCMRTGFMIAVFLTALFIISASCIGCELNELTFKEKNNGNGVPSDTNVTTNAPQTTVAPVTTIPVTEPPKPPEFLNPLTGLEATRDVANARPVSVCVGNTASSLPQFGLSYADILVEAPVEAGITRLMMISCNYSSDLVIGSVRSTRSYLADIANEFGAVQAYAGTTDLGKSTSFSNYDTMDYIIQNMSNVYYSDSSRNSPHHIMTNGEKLFRGLVSLGLSPVNSKKPLPFEFPEYFSKAVLSGNDSTYIKIPFSSIQTTEFKYNASSEGYDRYQFGSLHSDALNGKTLSYKNIIILFCDSITYDKATGTEISMDVTSGGTGFYISEGKYMDIIWHRDSNSNLKFTDKNGNPLVINRGKTYIGLVKISLKNSVVIHSN